MGLLEKLFGKEIEMGKEIEIYDFLGRMENISFGRFGGNDFLKLRGYRGTFKVTCIWERFHKIYASLERGNVPRGYKKEIRKIRYYKIGDVKKKF